MDIVYVLFAIIQSQIWYPFYKCLFNLNLFNMEKERNKMLFIANL